ncbi:hypothetical protein WQQ_39050 [Hydrocarboniphaga effusa AP103]|uniref:Uncharacterized protein n=1 Tax=Hydrocarboniphaga effusa AP103 TaxID=1172194 RepID=I8T449_9GAMM|nr:hypothetical protein WQQ_39050 [Hydrocarboniphaga effusa AP103]
MLKFINMAHLPTLQRTEFQLGSASALSLPLCSSPAAGFLAPTNPARANQSIKPTSTPPLRSGVAAAYARRWAHMS